MRWLVTGASGSLGAYVLALLRASGETVHGWSGATSAEGIVPVELTDADAMASAFRAARPDIVIHAGALASVDACFRDPALADRINVGGTQSIAELCLDSGARLVFVSTDLVFDGEHAPYREGDAVEPLSQYGRTKARAERFGLAIPKSVVARLSLLYGSAINGRPGFFDTLKAAFESGQPVTVFDDEWRTPLSLSSAAAGLIALARSDVAGVLHVGGPERLSRLEMGVRLAARLGVSCEPLRIAKRNAAGNEPRPRDVSLDSSLWRSHFPHVAWPRFEEACA